ncbi:MAG TPA: AbrB/MazE/SpoVT family DNA-binding domain-containing protein [Bryobacteraceae bacterium]
MQAIQESEEVRTRLNENGRLVIPASIRKALNLQAEAEVLLLVENGELRITTPQKRAERARQLFKKYVGEGVRLSEELIADRRKEAAGE